MNDVCLFDNQLLVKRTIVSCPHPIFSPTLIRCPCAILIQVITAGIIGCAAFFRQSIWHTVRFAFHSKVTDKK